MWGLRGPGRMGPDHLGFLYSAFYFLVLTFIIKGYIHGGTVLLVRGHIYGFYLIYDTGADPGFQYEGGTNRQE